MDKVSSATSEEFLNRFGVDSLKELPGLPEDMEKLLKEEVTEELKDSFGLDMEEDTEETADTADTEDTEDGEEIETAENREETVEEDIEEEETEEANAEDPEQ